MSLYTKRGKPLQVVGDHIYSQSGKLVGRISGQLVHDKRGQYVGTIDSDRLVYRGVDKAMRGPSFSVGNIAGSALASVAGSAVWGQEPDIPA